MRKTCVNMVHALAKKDPRVVFIGSDLSPGLLDEMKEEFPDRHYMEGVAEQNIIGMAAGMALEGYIPYVNTIATFITRRCFEQVAVDACLHHLPIRLIANGGGLVYAPLGPTHLAIEDMAIMRSLPNMTVVAVSDKEEMVRFMEASLDWPDPIYIRMAKGGDPVVSREELGFEIGKAIVIKETKSPTPVLLISTGITTNRALTAAEALEKEGTPVRVLHMHTIKPLDEEAVLKYCADSSLVLTIEEHTLVGGLGSAVAECLMDHGQGNVTLKRLGIPDKFAHHYGSQDDLLTTYGLQPEQIAQSVRESLAGTAHEKRRASA